MSAFLRLAHGLHSIPSAPSGPDYNPLNLPAYTIRIKFTDEYDPHDRWPDSNWTELTQVSTSPNVWDIKKLQNQTNWSSMVGSDQGVNNDILEILGANSTGVTNMSEMFYQLESLRSVAIFDTSSVENMNSMFAGCNSITTIPLFDTSSVTNMESMFNDCDSLATVPLLNTSNVQDMSEMFKYCTRLTAIP
jgi:surface protein